MEKYPQLFSRSSVLEDKKLELRLAPPGEDQPPLFFGYIDSGIHGGGRAFQEKLMSKVLAGKAEDSSNSKPCGSRVAEPQCLDKKSCSSLDTSSVAAKTPMAHDSSKRSEVAPVVGWPPVGSFRKNLANSILSKPASKIPNEILKDAKSESSKDNFFVKINMEGVPIGRKINLGAYNSYEELSFAIDELFKGLLAAQRVPPASGNENKSKNLELITSTVAKSDEYTLVYEDNEGDRMLVGDVPWHMFISTVKKLLVLKSSEIATLPLCCSEH
ncbi:auxin-responsive protein IAA28-like isoform X2 [Mangifera indica]|uniref:auxin-responsive protein IAA28-like isoform X2 n=1 Tax=Mangifera indica TaxID=29780 RepID=UPI001CF9DE13|nr:auxin-responsive protein IAA28-like isoform X2 [Mangifera indica]